MNAAAQRDVAVRRASRSDVPFLRDMLSHAYYWRWGGLDSIPSSRYVEGWGRPGDTGVVAVDGAFRVGAAWYRLFRPDAPGYGFVDERTPELAIAVVPSRRGRGFGDELLSALLAHARDEGYEQVSLSVERNNPALKLYDRHGFRTVSEVGNTYTMVARPGEHD